MPEPLSDQRREEIRQRAHLLCVCANPKCHRVHDNALDIPELLAELDRLHTWPGLMSLLDEHYPADVQLGPNDEPGPRILALVRQVDRLRTELATTLEDLAAARDYSHTLEDERDKLTAALAPICTHCGERNRDGCHSEHDSSWMCADCYVAAGRGETTMSHEDCDHILREVCGELAAATERADRARAAAADLEIALLNERRRAEKAEAVIAVLGTLTTEWGYSNGDRIEEGTGNEATARALARHGDVIMRREVTPWRTADEAADALRAPGRLELQYAIRYDGIEHPVTEWQASHGGWAPGHQLVSRPIRACGPWVQTDPPRRLAPGWDGGGFRTAPGATEAAGEDARAVQAGSHSSASPTEPLEPTPFATGGLITAERAESAAAGFTINASGCAINPPWPAKEQADGRP